MFIKTVSFFIVLFTGAFFRHKGWMDAEVRAALTKLLLYVTLPCAIISGFMGEGFSTGFLPIVFVGFILNWVMIGVGLMISRRENRRQRITACLAMSGYNIGSFALPMTQAFLPAHLLTVVCLFDFGNAFMALGVNREVVARMFKVNTDKKNRLMHRILASPPLLTEFFMTLLLVAGIRLPGWVLDVTAPIANANFFLSILLIGSMLQLDLNRAKILQVGKFVSVRIVCTVIIALVLLCILPYEREIVLTVILACCSPVSMLATLYTEQCGGDSSAAGLTYSVMVIASILMMLFVISLY